MSSHDQLELATLGRLTRQGIITDEDFRNVRERGWRWGSSLIDVTIGLGLARAWDVYGAYAAEAEVPFVDLHQSPAERMIIEVDQRENYIRLELLPWRRERGGRIVLATTRLAPPQREWAEKRYGADGYSMVVTSKFDVLWEIQRVFLEIDDEEAREGLFLRNPRKSAKSHVSRWQLLGFYLGTSALLLGWAFAPKWTTILVFWILGIVYLSSFLFRFVLTWIGAKRSVDIQVSDDEVAALDERDLPVFTVLVPMFREAGVLPLLMASLRRLDYPASKLDIKLVLEEGDDETIEAAKRLGAASTVEIIRVPKGHPQTKPKACNYALRFARGDILAIYDAEDQPEADQLKKVVACFRKSPPSVGCIQARLNYFNFTDNFLTRMFTLEYSQWFDFLLPGLHFLRVPIPLGGTSNHFRTSILRDLGAWDPYNVTEDADLGVRLTQAGYTVGIVNSTTFEEANGHLFSWIKQRSRWIKGYMQTWLVHMRDPVALYRSLGHVGFWGFQLFIGAPPLMLLINPILWLTTVWLAVQPVDPLKDLLPPVVQYISLFDLMIGNLMLVYFGIVSAFKRRYHELTIFGLLNPLYWVLHSIASYKALWQLMLSPHFWEKTEHGKSAATKKALAAVAREGGRA
ncbi:glycosyltransferase family 2 protein [Telmatospirillum siberiense]|uniref:glycosyltransferase family 2 protein n=1 Tax=Telmatospirillum siberiense TaxID=382514 RepID=UPI001F53A555|nr:glycosyltransferase [Telmatospirillum siberiense]